MIWVSNSNGYEVSVSGNCVMWTRVLASGYRNTLVIPVKDFMWIASMIRPWFTGDEFAGGNLRLSWKSDTNEGSEHD